MTWPLPLKIPVANEGFFVGITGILGGGHTQQMFRVCEIHVPFSMAVSNITYLKGLGSIMDSIHCIPWCFKVPFVEVEVSNIALGGRGIQFYCLSDGSINDQLFLVGQKMEERESFPCLPWSRQVRSSNSGMDEYLLNKNPKEISGKKKKTSLGRGFKDFLLSPFYPDLCKNWSNTTSNCSWTQKGRIKGVLGQSPTSPVTTRAVQPSFKRT